jgi:CheY-like chemotaxis protein
LTHDDDANLRVLTRAPGEGATFTVDLQLGRVVALAAVPTPVCEAIDDAPPSVRVLAAEDNPINRLVLKTLLGQFGLEPVLVDDGEAAVAAWETQDWDLILMDVQMPRLDGPSATRRIRALEVERGRPRTPIVALTANAMTHQTADYLAAGMDEVVTKPIEVYDLLRAINAVAGRVAKAEAPEQRRAERG